jgi:hypothetical protein
MGIEDEYTAFCFNEACALIITRLKNKEQPNIRYEDDMKKVYSKPSDFYKKFN